LNLFEKLQTKHSFLVRETPTSLLVFFLFHSSKRDGFKLFLDLESPICIFFTLSFNLNKWFPHIYQVFSFVFFRRLSAALRCSSSCAVLFDFASCWGVPFVYIETSTSVNHRFNQWFRRQRSRFGNMDILVI